MQRAIAENIGVLLLMTVVGLAASWPLAAHFHTAIPFQTTAGSLALDKPGDNLQLFYWFWLLKDNLFGGSGFMRNPYEFNVLAGQAPDGLYMYPLNFLYLLFAPLGDVAAYNCLVLASYSLTGFFTYLLVKTITGSRSGALLGALIYTLVPIRIINMMGGHLNGFIYFLLPASLYLLEKTLRTGKISYSLLCGLSIFWLSLMEVHLIYYLCVFLGGYVPFRLLCFPKLSERTEAGEYYLGRPLARDKDWWSMGRLFLVGCCLTVFYQALVSWKYQTPMLGPDFWLIVLCYPILFVQLSLLLAAVIETACAVPFAQATRYLSFVLLPWVLTALHAGNLTWHQEGLERILATVALVLSLLLAWVLRGILGAASYRVPYPWTRSGWRRLRPLVPVGLGLVLAVAWVLAVKKLFFAGSIAHGGRTIQDVKLFSPVLEDLFTPGSEVYLGLVPLVLIGYSAVVLVRQAVVGRELHYPRARLALLCFFSFAFFLAFLLGSGLSFGWSSLYTFFFNHFPFFNYPRVPDRIMTIAFLCGAVLVGFAVDDLRRRHWQPGHRLLLASAWVSMFALVWFDFGTGKAVALSTIDRGQQVYRHVQERIGDGLLLELPLWPGDSHQSSLYEYYITLDRIPRVNGYTPIVTQQYVQEIYKPLAPLNRGILEQQQYAQLRAMGVRFITVHDNPDVFPARVSPFPPLMTVRRLMQSPYLEYIPVDNTMRLPGTERANRDLYLFALRDQVSEAKPPATAAIPNVYPPARLGRVTGLLEPDPMIDAEVATALAGRDQADYLSYGPYEEYLPGNYVARFRMRGQAAAPGITLCRLEISAFVDHGAQEILAEKTVTARGLRAGVYRDIQLPFTVDRMTKLEFRTWYSGNGALRLEKIVVASQASAGLIRRHEGEQLLGETGFVVADAQASGGLAVEALVARDRPGQMIYGPFATYPTGRYLARFLVKTGQGPTVDPQATTVGQVQVTLGDAAQILGQARLGLTALASGAYQKIEVPFVLERPGELSFSLVFDRQADLRVDAVEVLRFGPLRQMPASPLVLLRPGRGKPGGSRPDQEISTPGQ